jgi:hypothetical protein
MPEDGERPELGKTTNSDLERAKSEKPNSPTPLDEEQLRQFTQFQQFQEFVQHQQSIQRGSTSSSANKGDANQQDQQSNSKVIVPRWLKKLGAKIISLVLLLIVLVIAGKIAYNHFFPSSGSSTAEFVAGGGGSYHTNDLLPHDPYGAAQAVYELIAKDSGPRACYSFDEPARQKFATDLGFSHCEEAVIALHAQVTNLNDYADSLPRYRNYEPPGSTLTVYSCSFGVRGGPSLGAFTVTKVEKGQWLITGHAADPNPCPPEPTDPDLATLTYPSHPTTSYSQPTTSLNYPTSSYNPSPPNLGDKTIQPGG